MINPFAYEDGAELVAVDGDLVVGEFELLTQGESVFAKLPDGEMVEIVEMIDPDGEDDEDTLPILI